MSTPPMAMAAYYLKGVAPPHIQLINIFKGCLPFLSGSNGLPLGVQLVSRRGDDARLLRTARWLMRRVADEEQG